MPRRCLAAGMLLAMSSIVAFAQSRTVGNLPPSLPQGMGRPAVAAAPGPFGTTVSSTQFVVAMDPQQAPETVAQQLADAGFPTLEVIRGLPPRHANWRMVQVPSADANTKAALLAVNGVHAVRPVMQSVDLDYPILSNGQVIVRFTTGTPHQVAATVIQQSGCSIARPLDGLPQAYVVDINEGAEDAIVAAGRLLRAPNVLWAHPSVLFKLRQFQSGHAVSDPLYPFQWHLENTGQLPGSRIGADIKAPQAWDFTMGAGVKVAVIDDCLQRDHEDLRANYLSGRDFVDQDGDPSPFFGPDPFFGDELGDFHGTNVAGIIAAAANNVGVRGVAPQASLIGCKIGFGINYSTDQDIAGAFQYASNQGAKVINNSWGGPGSAYLPVVPSSRLFLPDAISDMIQIVATRGNAGRGVLVLFSAGNGDRFYGVPIPVEYGNIYGTLPNVMAIGATLRDDTLSCYSNFGPQISVVAPGGGVSIPRDFIYGSLDIEGCFDSDITTTDVSEVPGRFGSVRNFDPITGLLDYAPGYPIRGLNPAMKFLDVSIGVPGPNCVPPGMGGGCVPLVPDLAITDFPQQDYTHHFNGTSAACPMVSGVATLVFSIAPQSLTASGVRNIIEHTADKVDAVNERFDPVTGHNERYGHGRVNAYEAVRATVAGKRWPSPVENVQNVSSQSQTRLFWENPDWDADGVADADVAGVIVARSRLPGDLLDWVPVDGRVYAADPERQVAPGVVIVANGPLISLDDDLEMPGYYQYAIFTYNPENFYAWGRRTSFNSAGAGPAPRASISASPVVGRAPLAVHFAGGAIDETGLKNLTFNWDFDDGTVGFGATVDHVYNDAGEYFPTLTVSNALGQTATTGVRVQVTAAVNLPPQAEIRANPTAGQLPLIVRFEGRGTDPDGLVVRYDWEFGDGFTGSGQVVEHVYLDPGTFSALLRVTDDRGAKAIDSVLITVGGPSATAAETEPPGILEPAPAAPCGSGAPVAVMASIAGLLTMLMTRRRR